MTTVAINGREFWIDGKPTYVGHRYEGAQIQGRLFNVRAVQSTFDDANPDTRKFWAYPDTGVWDPERNVNEFCAALPEWRDHGILAFTINFQGGGPLYVPEIYGAYDNNGFTPEGDLKPVYADRIARVLQRADELGMAVIVSFFYWVFVKRMRDEASLWRAAHNALAFLEQTGRRNLLIEIANEIEVVLRHAGSDLFTHARQAEMIRQLRAAHPSFLYSTSHAAGQLIRDRGTDMDQLLDSVDYVLIHGNGTRPDTLTQALVALQDMPVYLQNPKPIVINEDSPAVANLDAAWRNDASWGYYDQGFAGQWETEDPWTWYGDRPRFNEGPLEKLSGFQTPPVNWRINTPFKRSFFTRVAEITGSSKGLSGK